MRHPRPTPRFCALLCGILTVVGLAVFAPPATAKSFVFTRVAIEAAVGPDGSLRISESHTYAFDGQFSWATYRLPLRRENRIRDIRVADESGPYVQSPSGRPGTYQVTRDDAAVAIRWAFRAADESRTFSIGYVIDDVVMVYDDVAELYWKFIGTSWDRPSQDVRVTVRLPGRLRADEIRAWGHGPLRGDVRPIDGGAVLAVRNLAAGTMVEGRMIFPKEAVPGARMRLPGAALSRILREEGAWAEQANRTRLLQRAILGGLLGLPLLALGGWVLLYLRFGREPVPAPPEGYYRELPADYTPAELGALWRFNSVQPADFVATVLDLLRRGYLGMEVNGSETGSDRDDAYTLVRKAKTDGLRAFEEEVLYILFGHEHAGGERVTISRGQGLPDEAKTRMGRRFSTWTGMVRQAAKVHGFFDLTSMRMRWVALVLGIIVAFIGGWAAMGLAAVLTAGGFSSVIGAGIATGISGLVLAIGSGAVMRRSQWGADDLRRWQGFRRFLLDFSEMRRAEVPALTLWEHYLVYAVPLGVADRVIEQLRKIFPAEELGRSPGLQPWTTSPARGGAPAGRGDPLASFSAFTTAFAAATSSASSGSGGGGGFSGGGGGGGGGGGSGGSAG